MVPRSPKQETRPKILSTQRINQTGHPRRFERREQSPFWWHCQVIDGRPYARKDQLVSKKIIPQTTYDKIQGMVIAKQAAK